MAKESQIHIRCLSNIDYLVNSKKMTYKKIAERYGVSEMTVYRFVKKHLKNKTNV